MDPVVFRCIMADKNESIQALAEQEYKHGWVSDVDADQLPPGLSEDIVRAISAKKNEPEWLTEWRLRAYRHWLTMETPTWASVHYPPIDFQDAYYYAAPKSDDERNGPRSLRIRARCSAWPSQQGAPAERGGGGGGGSRGDCRDVPWERSGRRRLSRLPKKAHGPNAALKRGFSPALAIYPRR